MPDDNKKTCDLCGEESQQLLTCPECVYEFCPKCANPQRPSHCEDCQ